MKFLHIKKSAKRSKRNEAAAPEILCCSEPRKTRVLTAYLIFARESYTCSRVINTKMLLAPARSFDLCFLFWPLVDILGLEA